MEVTLVKNKTMFDKWRAVNHKDAPFSWDSSIDRFIEEEHFLKQASNNSFSVWLDVVKM